MIQMNPPQGTEAMSTVREPTTTPERQADETAELRRELQVLLDKYGLWAVAYCLQHPDE